MTRVCWSNACVVCRAYSIITTRGIFPGLLDDRERQGDVPLVVLGPFTDRSAARDN